MQPIAKLRVVLVADYWVEITTAYHSLPDYLTPKEKWDISYARMRESKIQPANLPTIPDNGNPFARQYAMAIYAMMSLRFSHLILEEDFIKKWK
jgi:hypothetical protein